MADSDAIMLVLGGQSHFNIIIKTRSVLEEVNNVRQSLSNLKIDLKKFHENCNIAKTVGMIHNVFGAGLAVAGCFSVLFTGGISFLLTAGSVVAAMTGVVVNVSTDLINISETAKYIDSITNKFSDLQWRFKEIEVDLNQYLESLKKLMKNYDLSENVVAYFIHRLETERLRIDAVAGSATHLKVADEMSRTIMKSASETTTGGKSFVISRSSFVSKGFGPSSINKKSVGGEIFQGIQALIKVCVVVFDIVSMTEDWNTNHPALEVIDDVFAKLYVIENQIRESLSFIECIIN